MNLLLLTPGELSSDGRFVVGGTRAERTAAVRGLAVGSPLKIGVIGGRKGRGIVHLLEGARIEGEVVELTEESPPARETLVISLPRPPMVKRIVEIAPVLGVRELYFVRTALGEKSYLSSSVLRAEKLEELLLLGMEQAEVTCKPVVRVIPRFQEFVGAILPELNRKAAYIADPRSPWPLTGVHCRAPDPVLAIGPERGWTEYEIGIFGREGFLPVNLGPRVLRVDQAVNYGVAQLECLMVHGRAESFISEAA